MAVGDDGEGDGGGRDVVYSPHLDVCARCPFVVSPKCLCLQLLFLWELQLPGLHSPGMTPWHPFLHNV